MLSHPFGRKKSGLLASLEALPVEVRTPALYALFPELEMTAEAANELDVHFQKGDQSLFLVQQAEADLRALGVWESAGESKAPFVYEEAEDQGQAALALLKHYHACRMYTWFWKTFEVAKETGHWRAYDLAVDVASFDRPEGFDTEVKQYFELCLQAAEAVMLRQRLWQKWAVLLSFRNRFEEALEAMEESWRLLEEMPDSEERTLRRAEWHNGRALIDYRQGDVPAALRRMEQAASHLKGLPPSNRLSYVRRVIEVNLKRVLQHA